MKVYIYGLYDPRNNELCYVGKAIDLHKRLLAHISVAKGGEISPKSNWIRALIDEGYEPTIVSLEETDESNWPIVEQKWIADCHSKGIVLVNILEGGDTPPSWAGKKQSPEHIQKRVEARQKNNSYSHSDETKKKISKNRKGKATGSANGFYGKKHPEEIQQRIRNKNLGYKPTEETKKKISEKVRQNPTKYWLGKTFSRETKEKLSRANKGRKMSPEFSEKLRQANLGKHLSEETKEKLRQINLGKTHSDETKEKLSLSSKGRVKSQETREKLGRAIKNRWQDPEYKARMSEMRRKIQQEKWNDPEYRAKMEEAQKLRRLREKENKADD